MASDKDHTVTTEDRSQVSLWVGTNGKQLHSIKVTALSNDPDDIRSAVVLALELEEQVINARP